ncbi:MAG: threonylcarbamoyl-AMP synthase [Pseudobutyrivibrio sp.]|jgi:L-threonylcarbamoyladenylate synthase|uniref:Threonylcarbamoyl-AMP synthase n=1 Tax=Pseudobutyrivibrio ruminis TaxID=46206 RepID=A0A2G3ECS0_9FIRM|nr:MULTISPECIES: L-threonylcarbamoyladenylate synthase [Pseudobutyrivibrio]MBE5903509.1 threonylcarbamoyl-AMP synthase [Pseudobutyrivibrio sp.]PHU36296.1 threonylcarbamoyl-AMP synthase [Pseudobutyrivibrio ruminis]PHU41010.1 threonylcarbamoyl-AMP synthase [Pseudobutyrivibrio ruminis]
MITKIMDVSEEPINMEYIREASEILKSGGLVAFPTETVYGLGGDATDKEASRKIYAAKGRPSDNPLIVHIAKFSQLEDITENLPKTAKLLADAFWPGPLTMVCNKNQVIPYETTGGLDTVAVRMPNNPVALALIEESGCMIAAPSANTSGRPSPTKASHVYEDLSGKIEAILDGGAVDIGLESTIVDLTEDVVTILRPGFINMDMLREVVGEVRMDPGIVYNDKGTTSGAKPKAPGMRYKHYAPKGDLTIISGEEDTVVGKINQLTREALKEGKKVGIIATSETADRYPEGEVLVIGNRSDESSIAHNLYDILRRFDELSVDLIYSESFATPKMGQAIMNRLLKAAGQKTIEV